MNPMEYHYDVIVVGAGFTGLVAAYDLAKKGLKVCVLESDDSVGGLAGTFEFRDGVSVEKFYHHWFNNDVYIPQLINELGLSDKIITKPTSTSVYYNGRIWKLSAPLDLLRFKPLKFIDRLRVGASTLLVRAVKDWKSLESLTIKEWLEPIYGSRAYKILWEPLITAKFSIHSDKINAVWMWKKLVLRGSTRSKGGGEELMYLDGGFSLIAKALQSRIINMGGSVLLNSKVRSCGEIANRLNYVVAGKSTYFGRSFIFTTAFPIAAEILKYSKFSKWHESLYSVKYLSNMCLVLRLSRSLSTTYWMNVNDPGFPYVGIIEHTNFDTTNNYGNTHIAYLSKYLDATDAVWNMSDQEYFEQSLPYIRRMFPDFNIEWVIDYKVWRAEYAQPVTEVNYTSYLPPVDTPYQNLFLCNMAQIYPEDRGTNYAVREALNVSKKVYATFFNTIEI